MTRKQDKGGEINETKKRETAQNNGFRCSTGTCDFKFSVHDFLPLCHLKMFAKNMDISSK